MMTSSSFRDGAAVAAGAAAAQRRNRLLRGAYFAVVIGAGAFAVLRSLVDVIQQPPAPIWLLLVALTCVTGASAIRMPGFPLSFSLSDTFTIAAAFLFGVSAGTVTVACDGLAISLRLRSENRSATRWLFNMTAPALAMWIVGSLVFDDSGLPAGGLTPWPFARFLLLFGTGYFLLNSALVTAAVAVGRPVRWWSVWRQHVFPLWLPHFVGTTMAGLLLVLARSGVPTTLTLMLYLPVLLAMMLGLTAAVEGLRRRGVRMAELRLYAAALRSTADAVVLTDPGSGVTFMNTAAEALTGWSVGEARGREAGEILTLRPLAEADSVGADAPWRLREYLLVHRDGSSCLVEESHAHIRDEDGTITGVISTFRDISQRKALERERLEALQRAEDARAAADAANRAKDDFLATLSHELRTPATAIIGWVHVLRTGRLDAAETLRALAKLDRSARAQNAVLNDLLDMSRIVRGTMRLALRRIRADEPLREALDTIEPALMAKSQQLTLDIEPDSPIMDADPDRLRQVFWNLLSNAVKFTADGGSIHVSLRRLGQAAVRVEVSDSGCGIEPSFLPYVFEQFRQGDSSSTRDYSGLGLGLAIVKHVVEAHGGTVEAFSDGSGKGSRFVVVLRVAVRRREGDAESDG